MDQEVCLGEAEVYTGVEEAARLIKERGVSYAQAAEDLGVMRWRRYCAREHHLTRTPSISVDDRRQLVL
jgi:hypothetical protein